MNGCNRSCPDAVNTFVATRISRRGHRAWIAAVLTAQWAIGGILMLTAFALLGWFVAMVVPEVGTLFLNYALAIVVRDLPGHAVALFGH